MLGWEYRHTQKITYGFLKDKTRLQVIVSATI